MPFLHVAAPAKLNLFLHITGKRPDGYHLLDSLMIFTEFGDQLELSESPDLTLAIEGPFATGLNGENNFVMRAARLLKERSGTVHGARMKLVKNIPVGAGLGGGSADAAAALKGLNQLWKLSYSEEQLQQLGAKIGSDIPACVAARPVRVSGAGEIVQPAEIGADMPIVLVNPRQPVATVDVYRKFSGKFSAPASLSSMHSTDALVAAIRPLANDLEAPALALLPLIGDVRAAIANSPGCLLARMSGSGATCFGLFADDAEAKNTVARLQKTHSEWWSVATRMRTA